MDKHFQMELDSLINFADGDESQDGPDADVDNKSTSSANQESTTGEESAEGTTEAEEELETENGEEDGGEESQEVSETEESTELNQLKNQILELQAKVNAASQENQPSTEVVPTITPTVTDIDLFKDYTYEDVIENEDTFKKWAKNLVSRVQETTQEAVYRNVPQLIKSYADQQIVANTHAQKFYEQHPDLAKNKADVAKNANLIAQAEPELDSETFFNRVADFTRTQLGIKIKQNKEEESQNKKKTKPALNKRSSKATDRMSTQPELAGLEKEIADMLTQIDN